MFRYIHFLFVTHEGQETVTLHCNQTRMQLGRRSAQPLIWNRDIQEMKMLYARIKVQLCARCFLSTVENRIFLAFND